MSRTIADLPRDIAAVRLGDLLILNSSLRVSDLHAVESLSGAPFAVVLFAELEHRAA